MEIELRKEQYFEYSPDELLGVMRFDFYDGRLANQWNPRSLTIELNDKKSINLKELQQELNYIQFDLLKTFKKMKELCEGTGYNKERLVYADFKIAKYVLKLIPVKDSYSYIYVYLKKGE